jgi:hypothetical protein
MRATGTSYGLTPTQERTLRALISARLQHAERHTVGPKAATLIPAGVPGHISDLDDAQGRDPHRRATSP